MAVKRDSTTGVIDMNEFENHLKARLRQEGYIDLIISTPDPNIRINSITSNDKLDISNIDALSDIKNYTDITVATLEENLWLLNGRFPIYQNGTIDGYISKTISNENGEFETNPQITVQLNNTSEVENFSIILNPAVPTGYPNSIIVRCYDSGDNLLRETKKDLVSREDTGEVDEDENPIYRDKVLDTLPSVNFEFENKLQNVYRVECEFVGTRYGNRRIRVSSVMFGKTLLLNQDKILSASYSDKTSFVPDTLPTRTFSFDLNNYEGVYNVDNPENSYLSLDSRTRVRFRNGYNVGGYEYNEDGTVKMVNGFPLVNNEHGLTEIEWDDWKELRLIRVSANADESATFECGSILDVMDKPYTQEIFDGKDRKVGDIATNILNFEGLDESTIEWSSDNSGKSYRDYEIDTIVPELSCREIIQRLAFSIGATILIKDNGKIKFANLDLNKPTSFTHHFDWNYTDFESIPAAEQLESITDIDELSIPKYKSYTEQSGDITYGSHSNLSIIATVECNTISQEVTYSECRPIAARISEKDTSGAQIRDDYRLFSRRGVINLAGLGIGATATVEIIGYPIKTEVKQERSVTNQSLVLETKLIKEDPDDIIKKKYLEWYKKKFKYNITTRGEPLVDAGDYGIIQTQFTQKMPVYILQNNWRFDGTWSGDMEVIALD